LLATMACNAAGNPIYTSQVAISPTPLAITGELPTQSSISNPTVAPSTLTASPLSVSNPERIAFASGATSTTVTGRLAENGIVAYLLGALEGQTMTVEVASSGGRVALTIASPGGTPLLRAALGQTQWSGALPESGDYTIAVEWLEGAPATYTLDITIPPLSDNETGYCEVTNQETLTAYKESTPVAEVFGTADAGTTVPALARTLDGWLGFDPGVAQAGNEGRARLRWYLPDWSKLTFDPPGCEKSLPYLLSYASIDNGTYNALDLGNITLTNGEYTNGAFEPTNTGSTIHDTHMGTVAFGDMNADNAEDAVIALYTNTGGTGTFVELALVLNTNGQPKHIASAAIGDRNPARAMSIADGLLTADLTIHDADDPFCCPSLEVIWHFRYQGGQLEKVDE
jgi:hypothetical protein